MRNEIFAIYLVPADLRAALSDSNKPRNFDPATWKLLKRTRSGLPKTKSAIRTLPLNEDAINALNAAKAKSVRSKDNYIFTKPNGDPIDKHLDRIWTRALKAAKVRLRPSYQLRHTFATQCILNGLPLPYISKVLGHSTIEPLVRHYTGWIDTLTQQRDDELRKIAFIDFGDNSGEQPNLTKSKSPEPNKELGFRHFEAKYGADEGT